MATINQALLTGDGVNQVGVSGAVRKPYMIFKEIDFAAATTAKGSALAAADVIQAVNIAAGTMVIQGGAIKTTAMTGTSVDLTLSVGVTGVSANNIVNAWDFDAAAVGSYGTLGAQAPYIFTTAGTVDILIASQTGTFTGGKMKIFLLLCDAEPTAKPGIAALGS